jgi:hypothetical protein
MMVTYLPRFKGRTHGPPPLNRRNIKEFVAIFKNGHSGVGGLACRFLGVFIDHMYNANHG